MADERSGGPPKAGVHVLHGERAPLVDRLIAPYFQDTALWPVAFVLLAHVVLAIAVAGLHAWRGAGAGAVGFALLSALTLAAWGSDARRRRFGLASRALLFSWIAGAACAIAADRYGLY